MLKVLKCEKCGEVLFAGVNNPSTKKCCGEDMKVLTANISDGAKEKHVPVVEEDIGYIDGKALIKLIVKVGSVAHPMTEEHHIAFIAVEQGETFQVTRLEKTGKPEAEFAFREGNYNVYEYCNLHGLWIR